MKKNLLIKVLSLMLVIAMMLAVLVACGEPQAPQGGENNGGDNNGGNNEGGENNGGNNNQNSGPVGDEELYLPEEKNYGGREFMIYAAEHSNWGLIHFDYKDGLQDSNGECVNNALLERRMLLEDAFGVIVTLNTNYNASTLNTQLGNAEKGQKHLCDQLFMNGIATMSAAERGMIWDLNKLDQLKLSAPYYDQRIQQDYSVNGMLFQMTGDFDTTDELVTFGVLYNVFLYEQLHYDETEGSPYEMISGYKWTYTKMMELAAPYSVTGAKPTVMDTVGIVSESQAGYYFFLGSGLRPIRTTNGNIKIALNDPTTYEKATQVLDVVASMCTADSFVIASRDIEGGVDGTDNKEMFIHDRALFRTSSLSTTLNGMPNMEHDFGILPIPMYEESQQAYYCSLNDDANRPLVIPKHTQNIEDSAEITEIISYYSRFGGDESLYESFFDRLTLAKICRKDEDRDMLILIFGSKVYDMDRMLSLLGMHGKITSYVSNKCVGDINSDIDSALQGADKSLNNKLIRFTANNK